MMNQVWNIFRKDFRHHWREIAASLALMVGFAWVEVREWTHQGEMAFGAGAVAYDILSGLVVPLVPISWMFLIVRAVQGESLVGDRQFWVTRPYDWKKLALAKVLFVLAFVNLPLFIADTFLLAMAGFRPTSYLPGLLWMQLIWVLLLLLPTAALATVTASIGQMLLALLFIVLYAIGLSALSEAIPNSSFSTGNAAAYFLLILATVLAVLLLQYSRRKTAQSRWLIAGLAAAIALIMVFTPYRILIAREYPLANGGSLPLQLTPLPSHAPAPDDAMYAGNQVPIDLPFSLSGLPKDSFVQLNGVILTLTNSQGESWDSGWEPRGGLLFPDQKTASIDLNLRRDVFDRMKSSPVHVRLLLAFTLFQDKQPRPFTVPRGEFALPDLGLCSAGSRPYTSIGALNCRVPLRSPKFLLVSSEVATSTCPLPKDATPASPGEIARGYVRNGDTGPADPGISPVKIVAVYLSDWNSPNSRISPGICPGTPLTLSNPEETGHGRIELQFDNLALADYQRSLRTAKSE